MLENNNNVILKTFTANSGSIMLENYKYKLANATGLPWLFHYLNRKKPLILTYHGLFDGPVHKTGSLPATFVHVDNFAQQMAFIKKKYRVISPQDILDCVDGKTDLPVNAALITFDDGYESFHRLAWPILKSMDISAVVFVPTRYVEDRKPFWFDIVWLYLKVSSRDEIGWLVDTMDQIQSCSRPLSPLTPFVFTIMKSMAPEKRDRIMDRIFSELIKKTSPDDPTFRLFYSMTGDIIKEVARHGVVFGGHTHSHTIMSSMDDDAVKNEISLNKQALEQITGHPAEFFAYPNGGQEDFDERHKHMLRNAGYKVAFSLTYRRSPIFEDTLNVSRINVNPEDTLESFDFHNSGIVHHYNRLKKLTNHF